MILIWLRTLLGTGNGVLAAVLASLIAFVSWSYVQRSKGRAEGAAAVVSSINQQTEKTNAKARKARSAARAPGSADRVRQLWCRDCD